MVRWYAIKNCFETFAFRTHWNFEWKLGFDIFRRRWQCGRNTILGRWHLENKRCAMLTCIQICMWSRNCCVNVYITVSLVPRLSPSWMHVDALTCSMGAMVNASTRVHGGESLGTRLHHRMVWNRWHLSKSFLSLVQMIQDDIIACSLYCIVHVLHIHVHVPCNMLCLYGH